MPVIAGSVSLSAPPAARPVSQMPATEKISVHLCPFVVTKAKDYERNASRGHARAAELSRRVAHRLANFLPVYRLVNPARAATRDSALRAGLASCNGPEPDRSLVAETSCPALSRCDPASARARSCGHNDYRFRDTAASETNAGARAQRTRGVAGDSHPDRIAHTKLSGRSRGVAAHG